ASLAASAWPAGQLLVTYPSVPSRKHLASLVSCPSAPTSSSQEFIPRLSSDLSAADPVLQAFAASASRILVLPQGRKTGGAHTELTSLILFGGGARLAGPASTYFGLGQFQLGSFEMFASVEALAAWLELILCGHSYGVTVARSVALQLCTCGLDVRGLVAIDPRCLDFASLELLSAESLTSVPRSLAQSLSFPFYRLDALELEFVAPLGPHKALRARVFVHLARGLAASWAYQLSKRSAYHLLDADHFSVGGVQAWDMSDRIK
ncbi:unnamed protein product, partial [Symbiodinium necroappetens]